MYMNALSRREEETLLKAAKKRALQECDSIVQDFAACSQGRTVSVAWNCKGKFKDVQECMLQYTAPEAMDVVRTEYLRLRQEKARNAATAS